MFAKYLVTFRLKWRLCEVETVIYSNRIFNHSFISFPRNFCDLRKMAPKVLSVSTGLLFLNEFFHAMIWKGDSFDEMLQDFYLSREKTIILFVTYCQKFS